MVNVEFRLQILKGFQALKICKAEDKMEMNPGCTIICMGIAPLSQA